MYSCCIDLSGVNTRQSGELHGDPQMRAGMSISELGGIVSAVVVLTVVLCELMLNSLDLFGLCCEQWDPWNLNGTVSGSRSVGLIVTVSVRKSMLALNC